MKEPINIAEATNLIKLLKSEQWTSTQPIGKFTKDEDAVFLAILTQLGQPKSKGNGNTAFHLCKQLFPGRMKESNNSILSHANAFNLDAYKAVRDPLEKARLEAIAKENNDKAPSKTALKDNVNQVSGFAWRLN